MKKSLIVFSIIFVLFFSMATSVLGTKVLSIEQITNDPPYNQFPHVYEDYIVWWSGTDVNSVLFYNILTKQKFLIKEDTGQEAHPEIFGDIVVWEEKTGGLNSYNLNTRQYTPIPDSADAWDPAIYGDIVVWWEKEGIEFYNLKTGQNTKIPDSDGGEDPDIYGDMIIWGEVDGIYGFNIKSSAAPFLVVATPDRPYRQRIHGDIVVWTDIDNVWKYNIKTKGVPLAISNTNKEVGDVDIYGDIVVWPEDSYKFIYGHNLKTGQQFMIRDVEGDNLAYGVSIYCGRVVWNEGPNSSDEGQIFLANLDVVCETAKKPLPIGWIMKKFGLGKFKNN